MSKFHDNRLRYLAESLRSGTMRAASENLNVAPSSISRQISKLEDELGVQLIERNRSPLKLTEAGEIALSYYREFTTQQEAFISQVRNLKGLKSGTVNIAVGEAIIGDFFLNVLDHYMTEHPDIRIVLRTAQTSEIVTMTLEDEIHLGMVYQPVSEAKIRIRTSSLQPLKVIVHPEHRLSKHASLTLMDITGERLGLAESYTRIRQILSTVEAEEQVFLTPVLISNSLLVLKEFVRSGSGVTILPAIAAHSEILSGKLCAIPLNHAALMRTSVSVITRLGRELPIAAVRLLRKLETTMPYLPAP
jgi:DNA-binding transcriptional LysR family regulator